MNTQSFKFETFLSYFFKKAIVGNRNTKNKSKFWTILALLFLTIMIIPQESFAQNRWSTQTTDGNQFNNSNWNNILGTSAFNPLNSNSLDIRFFTQGAERMRLLGEPGFNQGFLGIGTQSPQSPMHIFQTAPNLPTLTLQTSSSGAITGPSISLDASLAGGSIFDIVSTTGTNSTGGAGQFGIKDQTNNAWRMLIDQNGQVGIGTTVPSKTLDVVGDARIRTLPLDTSLTDVVVADDSGCLFRNPNLGSDKFVNSINVNSLGGNQKSITLGFNDGSPNITSNVFNDLIGTGGSGGSDADWCTKPGLVYAAIPNTSCTPSERVGIGTDIVRAKLHVDGQYSAGAGIGNKRTFYVTHQSQVTNGNSQAGNTAATIKTVFNGGANSTALNIDHQYNPKASGHISRALVLDQIDDLNQGLLRFQIGANQGVQGNPQANVFQNGVDVHSIAYRRAFLIRQQNDDPNSVAAEIQHLASTGDNTGLNVFVASPTGIGAEIYAAASHRALDLYAGSNRSGLRLVGLTSSSPTNSNSTNFDCSKVLTVNNVGDVILVDLDNCNTSPASRPNENDELEQTKIDLKSTKMELELIKAQIAELQSRVSSFYDAQENKNSNSLEQNFPNPFQRTTEINYSIASKGDVELVVFNSVGELVATLIHESQGEGEYSTVWDAGNLPTGIYFYLLKVNNELQYKKSIKVD